MSNPEFLREGSAIQDFMHPDRVVVGGHDREAAEKVAKLYEPLEAPILITPNIYTAEMVKYASNAFLAARISFINEIARICERVDADAKLVAEGMGLDKRIGPRYLDAGIGYGGSCFPKDVKALAALAERFDYHPELLHAVMDINRDQRMLVIDKLRDCLSDLHGKVDRPARTGVQAQHRRHARGAEPRHRQGAARGRRTRARLRPGGDGAHAATVLPDLEYTKDAYELAVGRRRARGGDRVERVSPARPHAHQDVDAHAGRDRRPQHLRPGHHAQPGLHVPRHWPRVAPAAASRARSSPAARGSSGRTCARRCSTAACACWRSTTSSPVRRRTCKHLEGNPDFEFRRQNVNEHIEVEGDVRYVLHFASPASPPQYDANPIHTLKVGTIGTMNMLGLAMAKKATFLLASTSEVYGDPLVHPQPESYWGNVNPIGPRGCYDEAKRCAEAFAMAYHRAHGVDTRIIRIFNTHGPRMQVSDGRAVPNFMAQALRGEPLTVYGDGTQTRSLCYVSDLIRGVLAVLEKGDELPTNLGNPHEVTMIQLAETIIKISGSKSRIEHRDLPVDDPKQRQPDITRARTLLGWEPQVGLEDGLQRTLEYFRSVV